MELYRLRKTGAGGRERMLGSEGEEIRMRSQQQVQGPINAAPSEPLFLPYVASANPAPIAYANPTPWDANETH